MKYTSINYSKKDRKEGETSNTVSVKLLMSSKFAILDVFRSRKADLLSKKIGG